MATHSHTELSKHEQSMTEIGTERAEEGHMTQLRVCDPPSGGVIPVLSPRKVNRR